VRNRLDRPLRAHEGRPTADAAAVLAGGTLLPAGGYKGFGLAALIEALAVGLVGADASVLAPGELERRALATSDSIEVDEEVLALLEDAG